MKLLLQMWLLLLLLQVALIDAQLSRPVANDKNMEESARSNIFLSRQASDDLLGYPNLDEEALANTQCPRRVELRWQAEVSASIYSAPLIADINGDGKLDVVVPSFVHYLDVLEGADGEKLSGWPAFHQAIVHSSPLIYDIDKDGYKEILLPTYAGEVLIFRSSGFSSDDKFIVPKLRVRKDWYVGLDPDHVDRSHPDVHDDGLAFSVPTPDRNMNMSTAEHSESASHVANSSDAAQVNASADSSVNMAQTVSKPVEANVSSTGNVSATKKVVDDTEDPGTGFNMAAASLNESRSPISAIRKLLDWTVTGPEVRKEVAFDDAFLDRGDDGLSDEHDTMSRWPLHEKEEDFVDDDLEEDFIDEAVDVAETVNKSVEADTGNVSSDKKAVDDTEASLDGSKSRRKLLAATVTEEGVLEEEAAASFDVFRDHGEDGLSDEYSYDYDDYVDESMWGDDHWRVHEKEEDFISIDAHILCTPVIADIDKDGVDEMIVAASFFFDREHYDVPAHASELGKDIDIGKYVAGEIVVFNMDTKQVKWKTHLDLSTDSVSFRAYIYSPPTVVDLDGEGYLSTLVGTSFGFVYALHHNGSVRANFPLQMGEIHAQVVAADVNDDGKVEILTADTRGNVAAWAPTGKLLWEVHLKSLVAQAPTVGDVNGDGSSDIVVPTASGNIYVLRGSDGSHVPPFPFRTHGRVMSSVLLLDFGSSEDTVQTGGLTMVTTSFDGYLYMIDGKSGCADTIDIGETSYTMVLADNIDGGDDLDLIVTTMNGNIYCFQTPIIHHPLKAWPMLTHGRNVLSPRYNREGIYALPSSRAFRDEAGSSFWVIFKIVDHHSLQGPYNVTVTLLVPGNFQGPRQTRQSQIYDQPGVQKLQLPCASARSTGTVRLEMVDKNGFYFADEFSLTFHMHYYRLLKWFVLLPMLGMLTAVLGLHSKDQTALPSFSNGRHLS